MLAHLYEHVCMILGSNRMAPGMYKESNSSGMDSWFEEKYTR